jgi:hypothetical protein
MIASDATDPLVGTLVARESGRGRRRMSVSDSSAPGGAEVSVCQDIRPPRGGGVPDVPVHSAQACSRAFSRGGGARARRPRIREIPGVVRDDVRGRPSDHRGLSPENERHRCSASLNIYYRIDETSSEVDVPAVWNAQSESRPIFPLVAEEEAAHGVARGLRLPTIEQPNKNARQGLSPQREHPASGGGGAWWQKDSTTRACAEALGLRPLDTRTEARRGIPPPTCLVFLNGVPVRRALGFLGPVTRRERQWPAPLEELEAHPALPVLRIRRLVLVRCGNYAPDPEGGVA